MSWGTVTVGRLALRERWEVNLSVDASTGALRLALTGQESAPPLTLAELRARQADIIDLRDRFVPITFTNQSDLNGYYLVTDSGAKPTNYGGGEQSTDWTIGATLIGADNATDIESRVTSVTRFNEHGLTGERWHAPPAGAVGYYTGSTSPSGTVSRSSEDGPVSVYRGLPDAVNPRWTVPSTGYGAGRARVVVDGAERSATRGLIASGSTWAASNGMVRVSTNGTSSTLLVGTYDGSSWADKAWNVTVGGTVLTSFDGVSVIRNDYEMCTVRLMKASTPGRSMLDLSIRRGSRVVECHLQTNSAATLAARLATAEAATSATGHVVATNDDAAGRQATCGCPVTFTADTVNCGLSKASVTALSFYLGAVTRTAIATTDGTFESGVTGWTAIDSTFTQSSTVAKYGTYSGRLTVTGSPTQAYVRNYTTPAPVTPGSSYEASMWAYSIPGWASVGCAIDWLDASKAYLSTNSTGYSLAAGTWQYLTRSATAPVGAAYASYGPTISGTPTGQTMYVDNVTIRPSIPSGDTAADLCNQYLIALSESTIGVVR